MEDNERRVSDVKDYWVEKNEEPKFIKEGDVVLLHNWGIDNGDQIIGVAFLSWDEEYQYSQIQNQPSNYHQSSIENNNKVTVIPYEEIEL